jgi:hypothetical protein
MHACIFTIFWGVILLSWYLNGQSSETCDWQDAEGEWVIWCFFYSVLRTLLCYIRQYAKSLEGKRLATFCSVFHPESREYGASPRHMLHRSGYLLEGGNTGAWRYGCADIKYLGRWRGVSSKRWRTSSTPTHTLPC